MFSHRSHDLKLLDMLEAVGGQPQEIDVFRTVLSDRSVFDHSRTAGRWNPKSLSVLYTSLSSEGSLAEIHFHLSRGQPVFPTRMRHRLYQLKVSCENCLILNDMTVLESLGVDPETYNQMLYEKTQAIGAAAEFLGYDGLLVPSARWDCQNLILFPNHDMDSIEEVKRQDVNWSEWRSKFKSVK